MKRLWPVVWTLAAGWLAAAAAEGAGVRPWTDYQVIMWVGDSASQRPERWPLFFQRMREMGVTAGMAHGVGADPQPYVRNEFPYYVENIVNRGLCLKWNSKVRDWEAFVTAWAKSRDEAALVREYCLEDPAWRRWAQEQMRAAARRHAPRQPLAYDIRDELSITTSANPFDFDFSPPALAAFRTWLQQQYSTLADLNREWDTRFAAWEEVRPFTTDQIKHRMASGEALPRGNPDWQALQRLRFDPGGARRSPRRWNLSPWADFRTYMDLSLAQTLAALREAAHEVDPHTPVGIEGTQMPHAFGGYDLWRLAQALDWVEPYDIGAARDIFGSFMPGKTLLTTVFETETQPASRRLWHLLLTGDRGCIIWWSEDCIDWKSDDYALTAKARALAPVLQEMTGPLARLFLRAERQYDPVGLLYSQPSIQVDWLIESCVDGSTWLRRFSSHEAEHNRMAKVRMSWLKALQDLGFSPRFVGPDALDGQQERSELAVVVLPTCRALSDRQAAGIRTFLGGGSAQRPRLVLADGTPALFDEHGKLRGDSPLAEWFPTADSADRCTAVHASGGGIRSEAKSGDVATYAADRQKATPGGDWAAWLGGQLAAWPREVEVSPDARVAVYRYRLGRARLVALERNIAYHMSEDLKQAGGNQALERPAELAVRFTQASHVYDLRSQRYLGHADQLKLTVDPWRPTLLALLPEALEGSSVLDWLRKL